MRQPCVYIIGSESLCLYIGVTSNLPRRVQEHKDKKKEGFTQKYNCTKLLYYEVGENMFSAIEREKQLKKWNRKKKLKLIESFNPEDQDLYQYISE